MAKKKYDENVDYQALIDEAVSRQDYASAGQYEQQRNNKILDLGLDYSTTNQYQSYLPSYQSKSLHTSSGNYKDSGISQADKDLIGVYQGMWNNAQSQEEKDYAHQMAEDIRSQYGYSGGADGSEYLKLPTSQKNTSQSSYNAPEYNSQYSNQINSLLSSILNRQPFEYDASSDPLYQNYSDLYTNLGRNAMIDTVGNVASLTGGYGSSWATSAGQQAYGQYNQMLNDKSLELQQMAYNMYQAEADRDIANLGMLNQFESQDYNRYLDEVNDLRYQTEFDYGVSRDQLEDQRYDMSYANQLAQQVLENERYGQQWDYNVGRDTIADERYQQEYSDAMAQQELENQRYNSEWNYQIQQDAIDNAYRQSQADKSSETSENISDTARRIANQLGFDYDNAIMFGSEAKEAALLALQNATSEEEYYAITRSLNIADQFADEVYTEQEQKQQQEQANYIDPEIEASQKFESAFNAMLNSSDPMGWLESNKNNLTSDEYLQLLEIINQISGY